MKASIGRDINGSYEVSVSQDDQIVERYTFEFSDDETKSRVIRRFIDKPDKVWRSEVLTEGPVEYCLARMFVIALRVNENHSITLGIIIGDLVQ